MTAFDDGEWCAHCEQSLDAEDMLAEAVDLLRRAHSTVRSEAFRIESAAFLNRYDEAQGADDEEGGE
jgi:hypothetical protein